MLYKGKQCVNNRNAVGTIPTTISTFSLSQMNNVELARTLSWRELEIANTELWAKWKGKTHFSRNEKERFIQANIGFYSKLTCHTKAFLRST